MVGRKFPKDEAIEIAGEVVARALKSYAEKVLQGGWSSDRASLKTAFITYCLFEFPDVYRRWYREETQWFEVVPLEEQYDGTDGAPPQHFVVGLSEDPAQIIGRRLEVIDALQRAVRNEKTRVCLISRETLDFTNRQIAEWLNVSEAAIEMVFYRHKQRHKQRLHPLATSDEPPETSGNRRRRRTILATPRVTKRVNMKMFEPIDNIRDSSEGPIDLPSTVMNGLIEGPWNAKEHYTWESPEELIDRSSLGTPEVESLCERAPADVVRRIVDQVQSDLSRSGRRAGESPMRPSEHSQQPSYLGLGPLAVGFRFLTRERNRWLFRRRIECQLEKLGQWAIRTFGDRAAYWVIAVAAVFTLATGILVLLGQLRWAGLVLLAGCVPEVFDGELSRLYKGPRSRRAMRATYVDQVVDRWEELILFLSIFWYYLDRDRLFALLAIMTLVLGLITSFERAEAAALRFKRETAALAASCV